MGSVKCFGFRKIENHTTVTLKTLDNVSERKITIYYFISTTEWTAVIKNGLSKAGSRKCPTNQHRGFKAKNNKWMYSNVKLSLHYFFSFGNRELKCAHKANMCFTSVHHQQIPHLVLTGFCLRPKLTVRQSNCVGFQSCICALNVALIYNRSVEFSNACQSEHVSTNTLNVNVYSSWCSEIGIEANCTCCNTYTLPLADWIAQHEMYNFPNGC